VSEEWQHPDRLADRFRGVLQDLDRCSPLNAHVAKNAAAAIREVLRVYRFLDELFGATATAHLNAIEAQAAEIERLRAALEPFRMVAYDYEGTRPCMAVNININLLRAARAALGETE
jgi:hypothetical protein